MNIFITGVSGFLGKNIVRHLSKVNGVSIVGADIKPMGNPEFDLIDNFEFVQDSYIKSTHLNRLRKADIVIHLARTIRPGLGFTDYKKDITENVLGSINFFDEAVKRGVKKFIFVSSGGTVYGNQAKEVDEGYSEEDKCFPVGLYGLSMHTIENYLNCLSENSKTNLVILRLSNPYGPFQELNRGQGIINTIFENHFFKKETEIWGDGTAVRDYIYIEDVCAAIQSAIQYKGEHRTFNIGSNVGRSINEIITSIETVLDDQLDLHRNNKIINKVSSNILNSSLAKKELRWETAINWKDGLIQTCKYYEEIAMMSKAR